jgi:hypothetical protein
LARRSSSRGKLTRLLALQEREQDRYPLVRLPLKSSTQQCFRKGHTLVAQVLGDYRQQDVYMQTTCLQKEKWQKDVVVR